MTVTTTLPRLDGSSVAALIDSAVALTVAEIHQDQVAGIVPLDVESFSHLHDFVDANTYGGLCSGEPWEARHDTDDVPTEYPDALFESWGVDLSEAANEVQSRVDALIREGRLPELTPKEAADLFATLALRHPDVAPAVAESTLIASPNAGLIRIIREIENVLGRDLS